MNAAKRKRQVTDEEEDEKSKSSEIAIATAAAVSAAANSSVIYSILSSPPHAFEKELGTVTDLDTLALIQRRVDELQRVLQATQQRLQTTARKNVPIRHSLAPGESHPTKTQSALTSSSSLPSSSMPIEVLRRVTLSGFFTPRELGRLLLWISKSFITNLGPEIIWDCLFQARWPKMYERLSLHLIQSQGHERLFRQLSAGEQQRDEHKILAYDVPVPSSVLLENQLVFFVFLKDASGNELFSHILDDQRRHKLLKYGKVKFPLENELLAGPVEYQNWQTFIHCVRLDTGQSCCLHKTSHVKHRSKEVRMEPTHMELAMTDRGKLLADRIDCYQRTRNSSYVGIRLVAAMLHDDNPDSPSSHKVFHTLQLDFLKRVFCVDPWRKGGDYACTFISSVERSSHGVTLLHFLEALDLWV
jgi:hypothetical protein